MVKQERVIHQDDVVRKLLKAGVEFNIETVFRTLRKLAEDGKIKAAGGGFYKKLVEDESSERLTKWFS